jgi:hypothetical protein
MNSTDFNFDRFDADWLLLGKEICQAVYINPEIQTIKKEFQKNGFLSLEQKSQFINICDTTKYAKIYEKYGEEGTQGYKDFSKDWERWFQEKGVGSAQNRGQRNSVEHILFGSTPDPEQFMFHFEEEMLGSMSTGK